LVNGIIGRNAVDCKRAETGRSRTSVTQSVEKYMVKSAGGDTTLNVFDTPQSLRPQRRQEESFYRYSQEYEWGHSLAGLLL